jgi:hypothetical protein
MYREILHDDTKVLRIKKSHFVISCQWGSDSVVAESASLLDEGIKLCLTVVSSLKEAEWRDGGYVSTHVDDVEACCAFRLSLVPLNLGTGNHVRYMRVVSHCVRKGIRCLTEFLVVELNENFALLGGKYVLGHDATMVAGNKPKYIQKKLQLTRI